MLRPLFHLATRQPQLLTDHVEAYADLVSSELRLASSLWKRRLVLQLAGATAVAVAVLLAGVATLLWAVLPTTSMPTPWLLWLVPLVPAVVGLCCAGLAGSNPSGPTFALLRRQWAADRAMLREASIA